AAGVARGDAPGLGVGVPVVDRVVVLDAGVGALPRGLRHLPEQVLGPDGLHDLAGQPGAQPELAVGLDGPHELVRHADGVVGVLVLDAGDVLAAEVHVEPGVPQRADLVLLARLGLDELLDVGVVDVQHDHLRGPAGRAARLDRPGGRVGAAHERDGPAGGAAGREQFLAGADAGEVEAGAGAALEDDALFLVPVQNG